MTKAVLKDAGDILRYVTGGAATFTLKSLKTGVRYTYKVTEVPDGNRPNGKYYWVSVLRGVDNENDYRYLGMLVPAHHEHQYKFIKTKKSPSEAVPLSVFDWFVELLNQNKLHELLEFWHSGRCLRCGRLLTTPESVARGIGPVCMNKSI